MPAISNPSCQPIAEEALWADPSGICFVAEFADEQEERAWLQHFDAQPEGGTQV